MIKTSSPAKAVTHATIEVAFFWLFFFLNDGVLNPNSSEIDHFFYFMILVVYLGHGILVSFCFSPDQLLGEGLKLPN